MAAFQGQCIENFSACFDKPEGDCGVIGRQIKGEFTERKFVTEAVDLIFLVAGRSDRQGWRVRIHRIQTLKGGGF